MTDLAAPVMDISEAFSGMCLRSGRNLGKEANDEALWNFPSFFNEATDLHEYPRSFQKTFRQFAHHSGTTSETPWSPAACLAFENALLQNAAEWLPAIAARWHRPNSAGVIVIQASYFCCAGARVALEYPNTRSYAMTSLERQQQSAVLLEVIALHNEIVRLLAAC